MGEPERDAATELRPFQLSVEERAARLEAKHDEPTFQGTEFRGYLQRALIKAGGELELTIGVPAADKHRAFLVADAAGVLLNIQVTRPERKAATDE